MTFRGIAAGLCLSAALALLTGCASLDPDAPVRLQRYQQQVSSGFTGCEPADNVISGSSGMG